MRLASTRKTRSRALSGSRYSGGVDLTGLDAQIAEDEYKRDDAQRNIDRINGEITYARNTITQTNNEIMNLHRRNKLPEDCSSGIDDGTPNWSGFMNCSP